MTRWLTAPSSSSRSPSSWSSSATSRLVGGGAGTGPVYEARARRNRCYDRPGRGRRRTVQALSSRRGAVVVIAAAALATLALIGFLAEELGGRATVSPVSPVAGGAVAAVAPTVVFALGGAESVRE